MKARTFTLKFSGLLLLLYGCIFTAYTQIDPLLTFYRNNPLAINPAVAGANPYKEVKIGYRSQWNRYPGVPETILGSFNTPIDEKNAIGFVAFRDRISVYSTTVMQIAYSFRIPILETHKLAFGLGARLKQAAFEKDKVLFQTLNDPLIEALGQSELSGDASFGLYYQAPTFYFGLSSPNIFRTFLGNTSEGSILGNLYRHYYAFGGYTFNFNTRNNPIAIEPSFMVRKAPNVPVMVEGMVKFHFMEEKLFIGGSMRTDWVAGGVVGFNTKSLHFAYALEFDNLPFESNIPILGLTHELSIGIDLGKKPSVSLPAITVPGSKTKNPNTLE